MRGCSGGRPKGAPCPRRREDRPAPQPRRGTHQHAANAAYASQPHIPRTTPPPDTPRTPRTPPAPPPRIIVVHRYVQWAAYSPSALRDYCRASAVGCCGLWGAGAAGRSALWRGPPALPTRNPPYCAVRMLCILPRGPARCAESRARGAGAPRAEPQCARRGAADGARQTHQSAGNARRAQAVGACVLGVAHQRGRPQQSAGRGTAMCTETSPPGSNHSRRLPNRDGGEARPCAPSCLEIPHAPPRPACAQRRAAHILHSARDEKGLDEPRRTAGWEVPHCSGGCRTPGQPCSITVHPCWWVTSLGGPFGAGCPTQAAVPPLPAPVPGMRPRNRGQTTAPECHAPQPRRALLPPPPRAAGHRPRRLAPPHSQICRGPEHPA